MHLLCCHKVPLLVKVVPGPNIILGLRVMVLVVGVRLLLSLKLRVLLGPFVLHPWIATGSEMVVT